LSASDLKISNLSAIRKNSCEKNKRNSKFNVSKSWNDNALKNLNEKSFRDRKKKIASNNLG
jgi:hypothetical protein